MWSSTTSTPRPCNACAGSCNLGTGGIGMVSASDTLKRTVHHFESPFHVFQDALPPAQRIPLFQIEGGDEPANVAPWRERFARWFSTHRPSAILATFSEVIPGCASSASGCRRTSAWRRSRARSNPAGPGSTSRNAMVGARAIELLISIFQAGERGVPDTPLRLLVEGKWFDGETARAVGEPQPELLVALE